LDIQREAMDSSVSISDLLSKTFAVASKLDLEEMAAWAQNELNGYKRNEECPDYRRLHGSVIGQNAYSREWCPVIEVGGSDESEGESILEQIRRRPVLQGAASIQALLANREL